MKPTNEEILKRAGEYPIVIDIENAQIKTLAEIYNKKHDDPLRQVTLQQ